MSVVRHFYYYDYGILNLSYKMFLRSYAGGGGGSPFPNV